MSLSRCLMRTLGSQAARGVAALCLLAPLLGGQQRPTPQPIDFGATDAEAVRWLASHGRRVERPRVVLWAPRDSMSDAHQQALADTLDRIVVVVVEPQDSARVRHRIAPMDTVAPRAEWAPLIRVVSESPGPFQISLWQYRAWRGGDSTTLRSLPGTDSSAVLSVWRFLAAHQSRADKAAALRTVHADSNYRNRMAAVALLSNFTDDDRVLHALLRAQLEADGPVGAMASMVLSSFAQTSPRSVDWAPVAPELHQMLRGTALFHLTGTLRLLAATGADSSLAVPLLRDGGEMLLAFAAAESTDLRSSAHRLLVALRGKDLGHDAKAWANWVRTL